jgi:hypothetical protein
MASLVNFPISAPKIGINGTVKRIIKPEIRSKSEIVTPTTIGTNAAMKI